MGNPVASALRSPLLLGLAMLLGAGCARADDSGPSAGTYRLPSYLPDGFTAQARAGCVFGDRDAPVGTVVLFDDDGRRRTGTRLTHAAIRLGSWDRRQPTADTGTPLTVDDILADAQPGTAFSTDVNGHDATGFEILPLDPADTLIWPAVVWTDGDLLLWLYGDGITELELVEVAESVSTASREQFDRVVPLVSCQSPLSAQVGEPAGPTAIPATPGVAAATSGAGPVGPTATPGNAAVTTTTAAPSPPTLSGSTGP